MYLHELSSPIHKAFFLQCACLVAMREKNNKPVANKITKIDAVKPYSTCIDEDKFKILDLFTEEMQKLEEGWSNDYFSILKRILSYDAEYIEGNNSVSVTNDASIPPITKITDEKIKEFKKQWNNTDDKDVIGAVEQFIDYLNEMKNKFSSDNRLVYLCKKLIELIEGNNKYIENIIKQLTHNGFKEEAAENICYLLFAQGAGTLLNGIEEGEESRFTGLGVSFTTTSLIPLAIYYDDPEIQQKMMQNIMQGGKLFNLDKSEIIGFLLEMPELKSMMFDLAIEILNFSAYALAPFGIKEQRVFILGLLQVALADNQVGEEELAVIQRIAVAIGSDTETVDELQEAITRLHRVNQEISNLISE